MTRRLDRSQRIMSFAKARRARGFTLVETLMALMILVVLTGIVAMGVPVAFDTYTKAVNGSNAQMLLSTTATVLRDELGMAQDVEASADGTVQYYVSGDGHWVSIGKTGSNTTARLQRHDYIGVPGSLTEASGSPVNLVSDAAITDALGITYDSITYSNGIFTVSGLKVIDAQGRELAAVGGDANNQYKIRAIMLEGSSEEG